MAFDWLAFPGGNVTGGVLGYLGKSLLKGTERVVKDKYEDRRKLTDENKEALGKVHILLGRMLVFLNDLRRGDRHAQLNFDNHRENLFEFEHRTGDSEIDQTIHRICRVTYSENDVGGLSKDALTILMEHGQDQTSWGMISHTPDQSQFFYASVEEVRALRELEQRHLLNFSKPFPEWERKVLPLLANKSDPLRESRPLRKITPAELAGVDDQSFQLSAIGKQAFALLVDVISKQLSFPPDTATISAAIPPQSQAVGTGSPKQKTRGRSADGGP